MRASRIARARFFSWQTFYQPVRESVPASAAAVAACGAVSLAVMLHRDGSAVTLSRLDARLRPGLAIVSPHPIFVWLYSSSRSAFLSLLSHNVMSDVLDDGAFPHPRSVFGLRFRNDLGNAAGLDKDGRLLDFSYSMGAGFAVVGTVLNEPHCGNVFSMLGGLCLCNCWTPLPQSGGALNSLGLPSQGVDKAVENIAEFRRKHNIDLAAESSQCPLFRCFPIGVSIMGHPAREGQEQIDGVLECIRKAIPVADFLEINESCPNVKHGGKPDDVLARLSLVVALRDQIAVSEGRRVPILVKLGNIGDADTTVQVLANLGVDGVVLVNTQKDHSSFDLPSRDQRLLEYYTEKYGGGLSGRPIKERALSQVVTAVNAVQQQGVAGKFSVVHVGGIEDLEDVQRSRAAGADLRQWYTGLMHGLAHCDAPGELYHSVTEGAYRSDGRLVE